MKKLILIIFFLSSCSFNNTGEYWNKKIVNEDSIDFNKDYTFDELNTTISELIDGGNLLPLSLKKTTTTARLYKVNFSEDDFRDSKCNRLKQLELLKRQNKLNGNLNWL